MKACVIQPHYSVDYDLSQELFQWELDALDRCDESMDLIVLPEAADVPCLARTREEFLQSYRKFGPALLQKAAETARRCNAVLFVNATYEAETGERNATYAFDRRGNIAGHYFKQHLTPYEISRRGLDGDYTFEFSRPTVITIDGIRYGFLTCYDFYFYEAFANMARQNIDVIIGCSHQRSDEHSFIELINRFCAYNCNAYMVRASVSLDESSTIGGGSMIVAPDGSVLADLENRVGMATAEFDPKKKYYTPAGFGNPEAPHYDYIEAGRRPWKYRPGGSAIVPPDQNQKYPRICAHRGFSSAAPENSLPALGAAVALGAQELEFDVRFTADGVPVVIHDNDLSRLSGGRGTVTGSTLEELRKLDAGDWQGDVFRGLQIPALEEVLAKFSCHAILNIHLKVEDFGAPYDETALAKALELLHRYDCEKHCYLTCGNDTVLRQIGEAAPHILRCCAYGKDPDHLVERAVRLGCQKVQFGRDNVTRERVEKAHQAGLVCNLYWADTPEEVRGALDLGIDTILSNNCLTAMNVLAGASR